MPTNVIDSGQCSWEITQFEDQRDGDSYSLKITLPNGYTTTLPITAKEVIKFLRQGKKTQSGCEPYDSYNSR
jgi:hypothetical protein